MTAAQPPPRWRRAFTVAVAAALAATATQLWAPAPPRTHAASLPHGPFPRGCVWRSTGGAVEFATRTGWSATPPPACTAAATTQPWGGAGRVGGTTAPPSTRIACGLAACTLTHAWLAGGGPTLHAVHPPGWRHAAPATPLTRNIRLAPLAVGDTAAFAGAAAPRVAAGTTLLVDFPLFKKQGAIAHWAEVGAQIVASLAEAESGGGEGGPPPTIARVVLLHAPRTALTPWVRIALAAALNTTAHLPSIIVQVGAGSAEGQVGSPLEGDDSAAASSWLLLERTIVPRDVFTGGRRTFHMPAAAAAWRATFHEAAGVALPPPVRRHGNHTPTILLLRKSADRRILNEAALVTALSTLGAVTLAEWTGETGVASQLAEIATADILVSTHTSALAAAHLVRPGTTIIELIPRNWAWGGLDASFRDAASARGGVAHAAWRARSRHETVPANPRDAARFGHWTPSQCGTEACVHAAAAADVVVDVGAVCAMVVNAARSNPLPPWPAP